MRALAVGVVVVLVVVVVVMVVLKLVRKGQVKVWLSTCCKGVMNVHHMEISGVVKLFCELHSQRH